MSEVVARVEGVKKQFGRSDPVLNGVDLEVNTGEVLGLLGPNGGGKSTLLLLLAGLIHPSEGRVTIAGMDASQLATASSGVVGLITAEPGLYPLLTGRENLHYFGGLYGLSPKEVDTRAEPLLEELGIVGQLERPSRGYSSGMRQKVSLTRALLLEPKMLLLDEPTSNLDPISTMTIHEAVRRQADQGVAVVLCTHDLHAAESICDRVVMLKQVVLGSETLKGERCAPPAGQLYQFYAGHVNV
jgi:ABC-2 type transport system ATP-binding protein